jgi:hypothetical protein
MVRLGERPPRVPSAQKDLPWAHGCQSRNKKFFTLFSKAGSNVVESAAILMEVVAATHEGWAELAKGMLDTELAGDDTALYLCSATLISLTRGSVRHHPK